MNIKTDIQIGIAVSGALTSLALKNISETFLALILKIRSIFSRSVVEVQKGSITNNLIVALPNGGESVPDNRPMDRFVELLSHIPRLAYIPRSIPHSIEISPFMVTFVASQIFSYFRRKFTVQPVISNLIHFTAVKEKHKKFASLNGICTKMITLVRGVKHELIEGYCEIQSAREQAAKNKKKEQHEVTPANEPAQRNNDSVESVEEGYETEPEDTETENDDAEWAEKSLKEVMEQSALERKIKAEIATAEESNKMRMKMEKLSGRAVTRFKRTAQVEEPTRPPRESFQEKKVRPKKENVRVVNLNF